MANRYIARVINLIPDTSQRLWTLSPDQARERVLSADPEQVLGIDGSFALVATSGDTVRLARSLDRGPTVPPRVQHPTGARTPGPTPERTARLADVALAIRPHPAYNGKSP